MFSPFSGGTSEPVCDERTACRVPALGKTTCQKSPLGAAKPTPMNRRSRFSRTEVTKHSTDSEVISLKTRTVWPGNRGASITMSAPPALTDCVEAFKSMASPSGIWQRTVKGIWSVIRTVRRRSGYLVRCIHPPLEGAYRKELATVHQERQGFTMVLSNQARIEAEGN